MSVYAMDTKDFDRVAEQIGRFSDGRDAEAVINDYLVGGGGDILKSGIHDRLPVSGRKPWAGKAPAAKSVDPLKKVGENLKVTIKSYGKHLYLYFPDDGSNTINHYGNQQFMFYGADAKSKEVADNIVDKLISKLEG